MFFFSDVVFYATLLLDDVGAFFSKNEELIAQMEGPQFCCLLPIRIIHWSCSGLVRGVFVYQQSKDHPFVYHWCILITMYCYDVSLAQHVSP